MTKTEANKIIETQIMGGCRHEWKATTTTSRSQVCRKCGEIFDLLSPTPDYTGDANQSLKVSIKIQVKQIRHWYGNDTISLEWMVYGVWGGPEVIVRNKDFCLAIATAALRTLGITDDIEN